MRWKAPGPFPNLRSDICLATSDETAILGGDWPGSSESSRSRGRLEHSRGARSSEQDVALCNGEGSRAVLYPAGLQPPNAACRRPIVRTSQLSILAFPPGI
uniref:Uncharacterized protein n=1 Tax=Sphaerodactylus townsendi TaxID=933632 RepID=A0ACB8E518_9SAUR